MINRFIFTQVNLDSGSLTVLASAIHKFSQTGKYHCTVFRGPDIVGRFSIVVCETSRPKSSCCDEQQTHTEGFKQQINIDLKQLDLPVNQHLESQECNCFKLKTGGYAVFYISTGKGGYAVEIKKVGTKSKAKEVFDSRKLTIDDFFTATVLRPGTYSITNIYTKAVGELTVAYPEIGKIPRNPKPITVECDKNSIIPNKIRIDPTQGLVFKFKSPSRIKIELTKPEDRPRPTKTKIKQSQPLMKVSKREIRRRLKINPLRTL
jgi:hypothetical protein